MTVDVKAKQYQVYRTVINHVLKDSEKLPSLPSITFKIRKAIAEDKTTVQDLVALISKDPALSALLIKAASSPVYRRTIAPKTLTDVVGLLGFATITSLAMLHSVRSLLVLKNPTSKQLFSQTWRRLVVKTSLATFFAKKLKRPLLEQAQMASLLTEVGSLAVLSAVVDLPDTPNSETYIELCRNYSKSLGSILLNKWNIDQDYVSIVKRCGNWHELEEPTLGLIDLVNLSLYYTVKFTNANAQLPALTSLAAYKKLPAEFNRCVKPDWLELVANNKQEIQTIIDTFR